MSAVATCLRVDRGGYPDALVGAAESLPTTPWFYTGALENRPSIIDRLARRRPLWGVAGASLLAARDPLRVADALRAAGLPAADVRLDPSGLPRDGSWLRKPLASAGGYGIEPFVTGRVEPGPFYYQHRFVGPSLSAVFIGTRSSAALAGVTRQWIGRDGSPFAYRGNVAPWPVSIETAARIEAIGQTLATSLGLVGLFGVDLVIDGEGTPRTVEVNPRYTASVEAIELATRRPLVTAHREACEGRPLCGAWPPTSVRAVAKEVLFADREFDFTWDGEVDGWDLGDPYRVPTVADVPVPGTRFARGEPVLTVFGAGESPDAALNDLGRRRDAWRVRFSSP